MRLQQRRDQQTRREIYEAAMALFLKQGFTTTTMAQIADAVGVSRRTVYRHFPAKENIAVELPRQWLNRFDEVVATREPSETSRALCRRGVLEVARFIQADKERVAMAYDVLSAMAVLAPRLASTNRQWLETYRALLSQDADPTEVSSIIRSAVVAGALVGGTDGALLVWLHDPESDLVAMTEEVWNLADSI